MDLVGIIKDQTRVLNLVIALACLDILSEMVAQGIMIIAINVSFLVAVIMLITIPVYKRQFARDAAEKGLVANGG